MEQKPQQNNFDRVEWYEVGEEGERQLSVRDRFQQKAGKIGKWLSVILIVLTLIIAVGWLLRVLWGSFVDEEIEQAKRLYLESCQSAQNIEKCISSAAPRLARQTGDIRYCEELEGEAFDSCIALASMTSLNLSDCKIIVDEQQRNSCIDAVVTQTLPHDYDHEDCAQYQDLKKQELCENAWFITSAMRGECNHPLISEDVCRYAQTIVEAIEKQDPRLCGSIDSFDWLARCLERTLPGDADFDGLDADEERILGTSDYSIDSDGDGLTDWDEVHIYGTDPANPDTDGDGYLDGVEVIGGYDPLR